MTNRLTKPGRQLAKQILCVQLLIVIVSAMISFIWGWHASWSALIAGAIAIIPYSIFSYNAFRFAGASNAKRVIDAFFMGEKLKILVTVVLMALTFKIMNVVILPFFGTYCLVVIVPLLTPFFLNFNHWDK